VMGLPGLRAIARICRRLLGRARKHDSLTQSVGAGGTGVQVQGDNNQVSVQAGPGLPAFDQRHTRRREPSTINELLVTDIRATTFVGRDGDLASLEAWLNSPLVRRG
jgi:hypothetical protein